MRRRALIVMACGLCVLMTGVLAVALVPGPGAIATRAFTAITALASGGGTGGIEGVVTGPDPEDPTGDLPVGASAVHAVLGGDIVATTVTDAWGQYAIAGLAPGTYDVRLIPPAYAAKVVTSVEVQADANTVVDVSDLAFEGKVSGTVTDSAQTPVRDALVSVDCGGGVLLMDVTGGLGHYTMENVPAGSFTVTAFATGFEFDDQEDVGVVEGQTTPDIEFAATSGVVGTGEIYGHVGVPDARVIALLEEVEVGSARSGAEGSDTEGEYRIYQLPAGSNYTVCVIAPGYAAVFVDDVEVQDNTQTQVDVALSTEEGRITGMVMRSPATPVEGATVWVDCRSGITLSSITGSDGYYTIGNLPGGTFTVKAHHAGCLFPDANGIEVIAGATTFEVEFSTTPAGIIIGKLFESDGATSFPNAHIVLYDASGASPVGMSAITDPNGAYELLDVPPDSNYTVRGQDPEDGGVVASVSGVSVTNGATTGGVDLVALGGALSGTVSDLTGGVGGALVTAVEPNSGVVRQTTTDPNGVYAIQHLSAGTYQVRVEATGSVAKKIDGVEVFAGEVTAGQDFMLGVHGIITGRVTDPNGDPVQGATVAALDPNQAGDDPNCSGSGAITDGNGDYTVEHLTTGSYMVTVSHDDYVGDGITGVAVTAGETTAAINFSLGSTGGKITGTVFESDGQTRVSGALVCCYSAAGGNAVTQTDAEGNYELRLLKSGTYSVGAAAVGFGAAQVSEVEVTAPATVSGQDLILEQ